MQDSIFTRIIKGDIPAAKIYEDDMTFAFLDIHPYQPGHTLVVPKSQIEFLWDLPATEYQALMATVQKVGQRIRAVLQPQYVGIKVVGMDVPHTHVHVYPFNSAAEYNAPRDLQADPDYQALSAMAKTLAF